MRTVSRAAARRALAVPPRVRRMVPLALLCAVACSGGGGDTGAATPAPGGFKRVTVGSTAPDYATYSLNGDSVSLAALRGRVVLLNVWATWCHPCRKEIPELQALHEKYAARGLDLVGVSVDGVNAEKEIRAFMAEYGMTYPIWRDPDERVSATFRVVGVPATFLIDRAGMLRWRYTGPIAPADTSLANAIERALQP